MKNYIWRSQVRAHEVDSQGIVNNAYYFTYFDNARVLHLNELGINWFDLNKQGFNLVLAHTSIYFLKPLGSFEFFNVTSCIEPEGKLKIIFNQEIKNDDNVIYCKSQNKVVCLDTQKGSPAPISKALTGIF